MKAIYKSIFFSAALVLGMASCEDKPDIPATGPVDNAEKLLEGNYTGEWTCDYIEMTKNDTIEGTIKSAGTIAFTVDPKYSNNVSVIKINAADLDLRAEESTQSVCNVTLLSSKQLWFYNNLAENPIGATFYGKVDTDGAITMEYQRQFIIKEGRNENVYTYDYSFKGHKQ